MPEQTLQTPATVPAQREAVGPVKKSTPVVIALIVIVGLIGLANVSSLVSGKKKAAPQSALPMRPSAANPQQVKSFETQQQIEARRDADDRQRQQELAAEMQQLQAAQAVPGPEAAGAPSDDRCTTRRRSMADSSERTRAHLQYVSEAQAEAKQKALAREKHAVRTPSTATPLPSTSRIPRWHACDCRRPPSVLGQHETKQRHKSLRRRRSPQVLTLPVKGLPRPNVLVKEAAQQPKPSAKIRPARSV